MNNKMIQYPCGLKLVVNTIESIRSVVTGIWVGAGSGVETPERNGIAHFTEHMMFKGTEKLSPFDIANEFESVGALVNAFTGKECTCYFVKSVDDTNEKCFSLLCDIFLNSTFAPEELDKERKVIVEEINMVEDSPEDICYDNIAAAAFPGLAIGQTILGPIENVRRFDRDDIRSYMDDFYCGDNIVVAVAGNLTLAQADKLVQKYLLPTLNSRSVVRSFCPHSQINSNYITRIKDFEQSNIAIAFPALSFNDPLAPVQSLLSVLMGGGMSSRLFQIIREQMGLAYSVYTSPSMYVNNGLFNIVLNISAENTQKAVSTVCAELNRVKAEGVSEAEFNRAKAQLKAASVFSQENVQSVMSSIGKLMLYCGEVFDADRKIKEIDAVKIEQVNDMCRSIFSTESVCAAYVGKQSGHDVLNIIKNELH